MAVFVDDDYAVIDVPENRQHRDIGIRQSLLQAMTLHGMRERCFLAVDANVIDTYIGLCASTYRRNAAMFAIPGRQSDDGVFVELANQFGDGLAGLRDRGACLEQYEVND